MKLSEIDKKLLKAVADLHEIPEGAYNLRKDGESIGRNSSANIDISTNQEKTGLIIKIKSNTKNESVHIPVIISKSGITETVRNDFYIGDNVDIVIVAGCGIHCGSKEASSHSGIHSFVIGKNSKVKYIEKHFGMGTGSSREMHPETIIKVGENSSFEMETAQIGGISKSNRRTIVSLDNNASVNVSEKILTEFTEEANTKFELNLVGKNSSAHVVSRSVAKGNSRQMFRSKLNGENTCFGHTECDAIVMDDAKVFAIPEVNARNSNASLVHEAAIGKIAGEQITKLMTLGLSEEEAQNQIIKGFLG